MSTRSPSVLLLAYGSPEKTEDVEAYYTHIRGGRAPSAEAVQDLRKRYDLLGGKTPLKAITEKVAGLLEQELRERQVERPVYIGMKHWHPYIADTVQRMIADGITETVAVALAPHYSKMSIGAYKNAVEKAASGSPLEVTFIDYWHDRQEFVDLIAARITEAFDAFEGIDRDEITVMFSAHSLPEKIRTWNDPYEAQLLESCRLVAARAGLDSWHFAWQSAGHTGEPWLGPDVCDYLETLADKGVRNVLSVPIGFVAEHLEVLFDIDTEAQEKARTLGIRLVRTEMPNAAPDFVNVLANIVVDAEAREVVLK